MKSNILVARNYCYDSYILVFETEIRDMDNKAESKSRYIT